MNLARYLNFCLIGEVPERQKTMEGNYMRLQKADFRRGVTLLIAFVLALMVVVVPNTTKASADQATSNDSNAPVTKVFWTSAKHPDPKFDVVYSSGKYPPLLEEMGQRWKGGAEFWAWCIDYKTFFITQDKYTPEPLDDTSVDITPEQYAKIAWITKNGYDPNDADGSLARLRRATGVSGFDEDMALVATQAAIWYYGNGEAPKTFWGPGGEVWKNERDKIWAIYNYLVDAAANVTVTPVNYNVGLSPKEDRGVAGQNIGPFTVHLNDAEPGSTLRLESAISGLKLVDQNGRATNANSDVIVRDGDQFWVSVPTGTAPGDATLLLNGSAPLPPQTAFGVDMTDSYNASINRAGNKGQAIISVNGSKPVPQSVKSRVVWKEGVAPAIKTLASVKDGNVVAVAGGTIVDKVLYKGLVEGDSYELRGELMVKETEEPTGISENTTFVAQGRGTEVDGWNTKELEFQVTAEQAKKYAGKHLVVFETLYDSNGREIADHRNIASEAQTVPVAKPVAKVLTTASVEGNNRNVVSRDGGTIIDTVTHEGLEDGVRYYLEGKVVLKAEVNGQPVEGETLATNDRYFTTADDPLQLRFTIDAQTAKNHPGESLVVFETVRTAPGGDIVATHSVITDTKQTVTVEGPAPTLKTKAKGDANGMISRNGGTITDVVEYTNLDTKKTYVVTGKLMVKEDNEEAGVEAESKPFRPTSPNGTVTVKFPVSKAQAKKFASQHLVVFEYLHQGDKNGPVIAQHDKLSDGNQTVAVEGPKPYLLTNADGDLGNKIVPGGVDSVITDTVTYHNVDAKKTYWIIGTLMPKSGGEPTGIVGKTKFRATAANGEERVTFKVPADFAWDHKGEKFVVFEELREERENGKVVAEHKDLTDDAQTVTIESPKPRLETSAKGNGSNNAIPRKGGTVVDHVRFENLEPGENYVLKGVLMLKPGGKDNTVPAEGRSTEIKAEKTFTANSRDGFVDVTFTLTEAQAKKYLGEKLVVFETLELANGKFVADHRNINDGAQTVSVEGPGPRIETDARKAGPVEEKVIPNFNGVVGDRVAIYNIPESGWYTLKAELRDTNEGLAVLSSSEKTFELKKSKDDAPQVRWANQLKVPSNVGGHTLVVYEYLYKGKGKTSDDRLIAFHTAPGDGRQQVTVEEGMKIGTVAYNKDGAESDKDIAYNGGVVRDKVSYENLQLNTRYTLKATLMKKDGTSTGITETTTFTTGNKPGDRNGDAFVDLTIDEKNALILQGQELVVFEKLFIGDKEVASHEDINDSAQAVFVGRVPSIRTSAAAKGTENVREISHEGGVIVDTITYENLKQGATYFVKGVLMDKSSTDANKATSVTSEKSFVADTANGTWKLEFTISSDMAGKELVVFEELYEGAAATGKPIAVHKDLNDGRQTVRVRETPSIGTEAKSVGDGVQDTKIVPFEGGTIRDTVAFKNLIPDTQYRVEGVLMDKATGKPAEIQGLKLPTRDRTFSSGPTGTGNTQLDFPISFGQARLLGGKELVVFEKLYLGDKEVASHENILDGKQTVTVEHSPELRTTAKNSEDENSPLPYDGGTIVDTVSYSNLRKNTDYVVKGELYDQVTKQSTSVVAEQSFRTGDETDGTVEVTFKVSGSDYAGTKLVVFEKLFEVRNGKQVAVAEHADINDAAQTVAVAKRPSIGTRAAKQGSNTNVIEASGGVVEDTVDYHDLIGGETYTLTGVLYNKSTGELMDQLTGKSTFTADASGDGEVKVLIEVPEGHEGQTFVVFETLHKGNENGKVVAEHRNKEDADQTVTVDVPSGPGPWIKTFASDEDGKKYFSNDGGWIYDDVNYGNLTPGATYTVTGKLVKRDENGKEEDTPIRSKDVNSEADHVTFQASDTGEGTVVLKFGVGSDYAGSTMVVYEYLHEGNSVDGKVLASHADIDSLSQTIYLEKKPRIETFAAYDESGDKVVISYTGGVVEDKVKYYNLKKDQEYYLVGSLKNPDGTPVVVDGKEVTGFTSFTTDSAGSDGFATVSFKIDPSLAGGDYVVYEDLYEVGVKDVVAIHHEVQDIHQKFTVESKPSISTVAVNEENHDSKVLAAEGGKILDIVGYKDLLPHTCYTLRGVVKDKEARKDAEGISPVDTPLCTEDETSGTVDVIFNVPEGLAGKDLVVFEYLYKGDKAEGDIYASHADYKFTDQTVTVSGKPALKTVASDAADDNDVISFKGGVINDTVEYTALDTNKTYVVAGELMEKAEDGSAVATGITAQSKPFTPAAADGSIKMTFDLPAGYAGKTLVVYERLYEGETATGEAIAEHVDINDKKQTVRVEETPEIETQAVNEQRKKANIAANGGKIVDVVSYKNLKPGSTYTLTGKLVDYQRSVDLERVEAIGVIASKTFVPDASSGSVDVVFDVSAEHAGKTLVVFETLHFGGPAGEVVATHEDLADEDQRIAVDEAPTLKTVASNTKDEKSKTIPATGGTIKDVVSYDHLKSGTQYTVVGQLFNKTTNELTDITSEPVTFTATTAAGHVDTFFEIPAGNDSQVFVAFETLRLGGVDGPVIATHNDVDDLDQTVIRERPKGAGPFIRTTARDRQTGTQSLDAKGGVIIDTVTYGNLEKGKTYTLSGVLVDQATGQETDLVKTQTFTAKKSDDQVDVEFTVPAYSYSGKTLVAYEKLYEGAEITADSKPVAEHVNRYDPEQTVIVNEAPAIFTNATNPETKDQVLPAEGGTIVDTVSYSNLAPFTQYTLKGTLMVKKVNEDGSVDAEDTGITVTEPVMAYTRDGFFKIAFQVPGDWAGKDLVVYEQLYLGDKAEGKPVAVHEDINDQAQTVSVKAKRAELDTIAIDKESNSHRLGFEGGDIVDTVNYFNLVRGDWYTVAGELMDQETGTSIEIFGGPVQFQAKAENGSLKVGFVVPKGHDGKTVVVFERLYKGKIGADGRPQGEPIASHSNLDDPKQTVSVDVAPKIWTDAQDQTDGDRTIGSNGGTVVDHVNYVNLRVGKEYSYTVKGKLVEKIVDPVTGEITQKETDITGEKTFTPTKPNGVVEVEFQVPGEWRGKTLVAFEYLYRAGEVEEGKELATHTDIKDEAQTVSVEKPTLKTTAVDAVDKDQVIPFTGGKITDTVIFTDLVPGVEYTIAGELMDKETGKGTGITASETFIADVADGYKVLNFEVPGSMAGKILVAFERLYLGKDTSEGKEIAKHADINDAKQTVRVETPVSIRTSATDQRDGDKLIEDKESNTVVDTVIYKGLTPGQQYTVTGVVVDKVTGEATSITGETVFVPDSADGEVKIQFAWPNDDKYKHGEYVAFERLYAGRDTSGTPLAVHEDINDFAQSFSVAIPQTKPKPPGPAGSGGEAGSSNAWMLIPVGVVALIAGGAMLAAGSGSSFTVEQKNVEVYPVPAPETIPKQNVLLAVTGADVLPYTLLGMVLLMIGGMIFVLRRRQS